MKNILSTIIDVNEPIFRFLLFGLTLVIILYLFPRQATFKYEFTKGKPWLHESIIAPFDFSVLKSESELSKEHEIVESQHLPIYNYSETIFEIKAEDFVNDFETRWATNNGLKKDEKFTFKNLFKNKKKLANTQKNNLVDFGYNYLKDLYTKLNFENELKFKNFLENNDIYSLKKVKDKIKIEIFWNEFIYSKYNFQVKIDKEKLLKKINQFTIRILKKL